MFPAKTYIARRAALKKALGSGIVLLAGNGESPANYADNCYRFRQDSTFLYYFGLDYAGLSAVIDIDRDREIIYGKDLTIDDIVWTGPMPTLSENALRAGVSITKAPSELEDCLARATAQGRKIRYLPPYRAEHTLQLAALMGKDPAAVAAGADIELILAVADMRSHKSAEEIEAIETAVDISTEMHLEAYRMVRPGVHEAEVAAAVRRVASCRESTDLAFPTIATVAGEVLHNHGFVHTLQAGQIFLLDAGAEEGCHYAGDLSSSMPVSEKFDSRQELIYNIHLRSFEAAIGQLRPGNPYRNVHLAAASAIAEGMAGLGLMKGDPHEIAESGAYALVFPCGTGHMMGLDVHDMENLGENLVGYDPGQSRSPQLGLGSLRMARKLRPGHVITDEPGIYFIPALIEQHRAEGKFKDFVNYDALESYYDFGGIRVEDDLLITDNGCRRLGSHRLPATVDEVEAAMAR